MNKLNAFGLIFALILLSRPSLADTTCTATCKIWGEQSYFTFDRTSASTYTDGVEKCLRTPMPPEQTPCHEVLPVSQGSSSEEICYGRISKSENIEATDSNLELAKIDLYRSCEQKYMSGSTSFGSYNYVRAYEDGDSVTCK